MKFAAKVLARSIIFLLLILIVTLTLVSLLPGPLLQQLVALWLLRPPDLTPPPPTVLAPHGALPETSVGLREWALYEAEAYRPVGSGFLLRLSDGAVIGVTTAHSVGTLADPASRLTRLAFGVPDREGFVLEFEALYGAPGVPRTGSDLTVDYVLLQVPGPVDPAHVLDPDPRGAPQAGERVSLYSGAGMQSGNPAVVQGTVQSVEPSAVWVYMDPIQYPGGMSGSPVLSNHTGRVIGMAIATSPRGNRYLIGLHPVASIVAKADSAADFPRIADYP